MRSIKVGIIDYGLGNIFSLINAFKIFDVDSLLVKEPGQIKGCTHLILPGVGGFAKASSSLEKSNLRIEFSNAVSNGTPVFGICLGMQLFFEESLEGGKSNGLGIMPGIVRKLDLQNTAKVPHVQWNAVKYFGANPIEQEILNEQFFYFSHSYAVLETELSNLTAYGITEYGSKTFLSYARSDNIFMSQFHPEKSGPNGLKLLKSFIGV